MERCELIEEARRRFPAGLRQPEGSFRFSADALLLAEFAAEQCADGPGSFADVGSGCGVVALALLLRKERWSGVGLEILPGPALAAAENAALLGLDGRFRMELGDAGDPGRLRAVRRALASMRGDSGGQPMFDAVVSNPPWKLSGEGRTPPSDARRTALFGDGKTFGIFFGAADALLRQGGALYAVSGAGRTADMLEALPGRMRPELLRFVFTKQGAPAEFVLLKAVKNGRGNLRVEASGPAAD